MQNLQVGLGAVLALDTSAFLARQPPPRQPETTRHDGITPSNTPPSIRHPTHRLLWDAPENRASGPPSTPVTLTELIARAKALIDGVLGPRPPPRQLGQRGRMTNERLRT